MSEKEEKLTKELKEMFARAYEEQDKYSAKTAENHEDIMQMIDEASKK